MRRKEKKQRKIFRKLAAVFSRLTPEEDEDIQERVSKEIPFTADCDPDETEWRQIEAAYHYAIEMLYKKSKGMKLC